MEYLSFFPVFVDQVEKNPDFKSLSSVQKLYYWLLASEFNAYGEFYRADDWFAAALGLKSVDTIRKARVKFGQMGWIKYTSGRRTKRNQNLATTYHDVKWAVPTQEGQGFQYSKMQRYAFEALLQRIRDKIFTHDDLVVYVYLNHWHALHGETPIGKRSLCNMIGNMSTQKLMQCIWRLSDTDRFSFANENTPLFDFVNLYQSISITKLRTFVEPAEDEDMLQLAKEYHKDIEKRMRQLREKRNQKELEKAEKQGKVIAPEQLPDVFRRLYIAKYGKHPSTPYPSHEQELIALGERYGPQTVANALHDYFNADVVPNPTNAKYRTLARFLHVYEYFIERQRAV